MGTIEIEEGEEKAVARVEAVERAESVRAMQKLVLTHRTSALRMSRSILRRWGSRVDGEELEGVVDVAICQAAASYDPQRGTTFTSFLFHFVRGELIGLVREHVEMRRLRETCLLSVRHVQASNGGTTHQQGESGEISSEWASLVGSITPEDAVERSQMSEALRLALGALTEEQQHLIRLIYFEGRPMQSIMQSLALSRAEVKTRAAAAVRQLRTGMGISESNRELGGLPGTVFGLQQGPTQSRTLRRRRPLPGVQKASLRQAHRRAVSS
ncbi:MAG: sigma-70 family RNA polymerase sigma factor [Bdellovibrionales bacterium]|nr:sigma-70 family RNA polymerase sigma factor [Bdellovibrionales bacterium]